MKLGSTISSLREKKGVRQGDFAKEIEISQTYLSQIENDRKLPNISQLSKISAALKIPLPFIFILSLDETDVPKSKAAHYKLLEPAMKKFVQELIEEND
jgi:transcriptional regulator with XRE-family HTH domain